MLHVIQNVVFLSRLFNSTDKLHHTKNCKCIGSLPKTKKKSECKKSQNSSVSKFYESLYE